MEETQGDRQLFDGWMAAVSAGDRAAFACLYDRLKAPVYGLALSILRVRDDAEDVMQNTFLRYLDETERQVVMLFAVGGYSHKEIAAVLEKPYVTVRWKYSNAMKKLKRHLEDTEEPAGKEEHPLWLQTKN